MNIDEKDFEKWKLGMIGEGKFRNDLISNRINFMQIDALYESEGKWYSVEIKTQEMFKSPPFDGHGLPRWQIDARLKLYEDKGIIPIFVVYDLKENIRYNQSLLFLESKKDYYQTKGKSPRVIYKLSHFQKKIIDD